MADVQPDPFSQPRPRWLAGDWLIRILLPLFIAAGALAKVLYGSPLEVPQFVLWAGDRIGVGVVRTYLLIIAVELCLATVMALHRLWSVWLARGTLCLFISVLVLQLLDKQSSCGCFGAASPPVGWMLALECTLLALTFVLPRRDSRRSLAARGQPPADVPDVSGLRYAVMWLLCVVLSAGAFSTFRFNLIGALRPDEDMIEIELLRDARGKRFEDLRLAKYLGKKPSDFPQANQHWVIYRKSCPFCHELFDTRYSAQTPAQRKLDRVAIAVVAVEIPPFSPAGSVPAASAQAYSDINCDRCQHVAFPATRDWKVHTPIIITVDHGVVVEVERGVN